MRAGLLPPRQTTRGTNHSVCERETRLGHCTQDKPSQNHTITHEHTLHVNTHCTARHHKTHKWQTSCITTHTHTHAHAPCVTLRRAVVHTTTCTPSSSNAHTHTHAMPHLVVVVGVTHGRGGVDPRRKETPVSVCAAVHIICAKALCGWRHGGSQQRAERCPPPPPPPQRTSPALLCPPSLPPEASDRCKQAVLQNVRTGREAEPG